MFYLSNVQANQKLFMLMQNLKVEIQRKLQSENIF